MERITMKRAIQFFALLLISVFVLTGCGKGGGASHGLNEPDPVGVAATNGVEGVAVKGRISGATVTVVDANGDEVPGATATTAADGSYTIEFVATNTAIPVPIQVIVEGTGANAQCDVVNSDGSGDDCMDLDGTYVSFGETFKLPPGFAVRAVHRKLPDPVAGGSSVTINVNPLTEMATAIALADGTTLTDEEVAAANAKVLGIVQLLFPDINVNAELAAGGYGLNNIPIPDITDLENEDTANISALSYTMASVAAAFAALVDPLNSDYADLNQVIATLTAGVTSTTGITNGVLGILGAAAADAMATVVDELGAIVDVELPADLSLVDLGDMADGAGEVAIVRIDDPDTIPTIPDIDDTYVPPTDEENAVAATKAGVVILSDMVDALVDLTGYTAGAVGAGSVPELYHTQFMSIADLHGLDSLTAFDNLLDGINTAAHAIKLGETSVTATATDLSYTVTGTEAATGSSFAVTEATSVSGDVTLEVASGTRTVVEVDGVETTGTFAATGVTLESAAVQTFTGSITATFTAETAGLGLTSLEMDGSIDVTAVTGGTAGGVWGVEVDLTGITGTTSTDASADLAATYSATFNLGIVDEDALSITLGGTRSKETGTLDTYSITMGDETIDGTFSRSVDASGNITDTNTLTNDYMTLTLTVLIPTVGASSATGVLSSGGFTTGALDEAGNITYTDDTVQNLNAAIFN